MSEEQAERERANISRRAIMTSALQWSAVVATGGLTNGILSGVAAAEDQPAIGTFPAGSSGSSVFISIGVPRTGTYAAAGEDELKGHQLAIQHLNEGNPLLSKISPNIKKGVLGRTVTFGVGDSEAKPNTAIQVHTRFIHQNQAVLMTGSVSSAVAVALNKLAQREKVIYLPVISGSNDTTGKDCARYSFRESFYAQTAAKALSPFLINALGKNKKVAYLTPDYTYGHSVFNAMQTFTKEGGWTTATNQLSPLGTSDFSSYLLNVANSGADVLININFGNDAVLSTKQAKQFGLLDKMTLAVPYIAPFLAKEVGAETMQGVYMGTDYWWTLEDKFPLAKAFNEAFVAQYKYRPEWGAMSAYMQIAMWADAVERAKTFYPPAVIKAYEAGFHVQSPVGEVYYRAADHQLVRPVIIARGKKPGEMKSPDDYYEVVEIVPGEGLMQDPGAFGCKLGDYT